jgi:hypothetical protein
MLCSKYGPKLVKNCTVCKLYILSYWGKQRKGIKREGKKGLGLLARDDILSDKRGDVVIAFWTCFLMALRLDSYVWDIKNISPEISGRL